MKTSMKRFTMGTVCLAGLELSSAAGAHALDRFNILRMPSEFSVMPFADDPAQTPPLSPLLPIRHAKGTLKIQSWNVTFKDRNTLVTATPLCELSVDVPVFDASKIDPSQGWSFEPGTADCVGQLEKGGSVKITAWFHVSFNHDFSVVPLDPTKIVKSFFLGLYAPPNNGSGPELPYDATYSRFGEASSEDLSLSNLKLAVDGLEVFRQNVQPNEIYSEQIMGTLKVDDLIQKQP